MRKRIDKEAIQKEQAQMLRTHGMGYKRIASIIGTDRDTARNFCKSISVMEDKEIHDLDDRCACSYCGGAIEQPVGAGRLRRFCSDHCRRQYWRLHREEQKKNPAILFTRTCRYCGQPFVVYGKNDRKYCCRDHYLQHFYGDAYGSISRTRRAICPEVPA